MGIILDGIALGVLLGCGIWAWRKGFLCAAFGFLPMLAALIGTKFFSPYIGKFLRSTHFFGSLADSIKEKMGLEQIVSENILKTQTEIIEGMRLPDFLKEALLENNNPVIYELLDVDKIQDYIAGFLANICINILSVVLAFLVIYIAAALLLRALNLFSRLPVLNFMNRFGGFLLGAAKGLCFLWVGCIVLTFFQCNASWESVFSAMETTLAAKWIYENNLLLALILTIFT